MRQNLDELIKQVKDFCEERDWDQFHNPKDLAIGISTEANELLDLFRFKNLEQVNKIMQDPQELQLIKDELADILFFVLRFAQMNQLDLGEVLSHKMEKSARKYPVELSKGNNTKYNRL